MRIARIDRHREPAHRTMPPADEEPAGDEPPRGRSTGRGSRVMQVVARGVGELCITFGAIILLYVVYQMYWTNVLSNNTMQSEINKIMRQWGQSSVSGVQTALPTYEPGAGFAVLRIPRLGNDYMKPILAGIDPLTLTKGLGHYSGTAMPGQDGNFSVAGHRGGHGEPFRHLDTVQPGDALIVETASTWYTYVIRKGPYITGPEDVDVIAPVPAKAFDTPGRYITLTTCDPWWSSERRMIIWGVLESQQPKSAGLPPALKS